MNKNKRKFDKEYSTYYTKERDFLASRGIMYDFVKLDEQDLSIFKYKKSHKLFSALADFYKEL